MVGSLVDPFTGPFVGRLVSQCIPCFVSLFGDTFIPQSVCWLVCPRWFIWLVNPSADPWLVVLGLLVCVHPSVSPLVLGLAFPSSLDLLLPRGFSWSVLWSLGWLVTQSVSSCLGRLMFVALVC